MKKKKNVKKLGILIEKILKRRPSLIFRFKYQNVILQTQRREPTNNIEVMKPLLCLKLCCGIYFCRQRTNIGRYNNIVNYILLWI